MIDYKMRQSWSQGMRARMSAALLLFLMALGLTLSLAWAQDNNVWPEITFTHKQPFRLAATAVDVVEDYVPPLTAPHVEHQSPVPPVRAVRFWVRDRLRAMGGLHRLVVRIKEASVVAAPLETTSGFKGFFINDQSEKYTGTLTVRLEVMAVQTGQVVQWVEASAQHSQTVPEDISLADREMVYFRLTERLIQALDVELERQVQTHLTPYLIP